MDQVILKRLKIPTVSITLNEIQFDWDSRKAEANLRKHKVSFETACEVFFDPFLVVVEAVSIDGETREASELQ